MVNLPIPNLVEIGSVNSEMKHAEGKVGNLIVCPYYAPRANNGFQLQGNVPTLGHYSTKTIGDEKVNPFMLIG
jgi:hypothetical protein